MFISAQKTVTDLIEDKIKNRQIFLIILPYLQTSRTKTISGINELYKIIDVSQIENTYRDFKIGEAALQMSELDVRKDCTTTENTNQYGSRRIADTNYSSNLSKEFVSKLSVKTQPLI
jgi:hypothetical protein